MFKIFSKSKFFICVFAFISICFFSSFVSAFSVDSEYYNDSTQSWIPTTYNFGDILGVSEGKSPKTYYTDTLNNFIDWTVLHYSISDTARLTIVNETDTYYEVNFFDLLGNPVQHYIWCGRDGNQDGIATSYQNELTSESFTIYKDFETRSYTVFSGKIYNSDGSLFFPQPPMTETEKIMKEAGEIAKEKLEGVILIVIMGIAGLIILLIGLRKGLTVLMNGLRH